MNSATSDGLVADAGKRRASAGGRTVGQGIEWRGYTLVLLLVVAWLVLHYLTGGLFITPRNIMLLLRQGAIVGVMTLGMVLIIAAGEIDLSVGSAVAFTGIVAAELQAVYSWSTPLTILAALAAGALIGLIQGTWIAKFGTASFIVTLAGMLYLRGGGLVVTNAYTISGMQASLRYFGDGFIPGMIVAPVVLAGIVVYVAGVVRESRSRGKVGLDKPPINAVLARVIGAVVLGALFTLAAVTFEGVPVPVGILLVFAVIFHFITRRTSLGRHVYAIGGNRETSRLAGINTRKILVAIYTIMGLLYGVGGIILTARLNGAPPNTGTFMELDVIAATVIGGASLLGGRGTIVGALMGALLVESLSNGMSLMNISSFYQYIAKGIILLLVVTADTAARRQQVAQR